MEISKTMTIKISKAKNCLNQQLTKLSGGGTLAGKRQQHSVLALNNWLLRVVDWKRVSPRDVHSLGANGNRLMRRRFVLSCPPAQDWFQLCIGTGIGMGIAIDIGILSGATSMVH